MKTLKPCGTNAAYQRHIKHREEPCEPCRQASRDYTNAWRNGKLPKRDLAPCGTRSAYHRHLRHREKPCYWCRRANGLTCQAQRRLKELYHDEFAVLRSEEVPEPVGWMRALSALARNHRVEFKALLAECRDELAREQCQAVAS